MIGTNTTYSKCLDVYCIITLGLKYIITNNIKETAIQNEKISSSSFWQMCQNTFLLLGKFSSLCQSFGNKHQWIEFHLLPELILYGILTTEWQCEISGHWHPHSILTKPIIEEF